MFFIELETRPVHLAGITALAVTKHGLGLVLNPIRSDRVKLRHDEGAEQFVDSRR